MSEIYKGRGNASMRDDFLDFINLVFGFNGNDEDFLKLLPKLYKEQYQPCENNYVVTEDGKLKSAIGVFKREMIVGTERLQVHGIGNVAVHPYARSRGYMRELMTMAVQDMIKNGADLSDLGGKRHRYAYFSYECASPSYRFDIGPSDLRHKLASLPAREITFREVKEGDALVSDVIALHDTRLCRMDRPAESFMDIVHSWTSKLFAILEGSRFLGYYIGGMGELTLCDNADFDAVMRAYIEKNGRFTLKLAGWQTDLIRRAYRICDGCSLGNDQNYSIFHFKKVVSAFLALKAETGALPDGSMSFTVNGIAGTEKFRVTVKNGAPAVEACEGDTDVTLEHLPAVAYFFGVISPERTLTPLANAWFPLPLFISGADHV